MHFNEKVFSHISEHVEVTGKLQPKSVDLARSGVGLLFRERIALPKSVQQRRAVKPSKVYPEEYSHWQEMHAHRKL